MRENKKTKLRVFWLILVIGISLVFVVDRSGSGNKPVTEKVGLTEPVAAMNPVDNPPEEKGREVEQEVVDDTTILEQTGCETMKVWVVDKAAYDEQVWVEGGTETVHHEEEGHYKITKHDEEGHYETVEKQEWVIDIPAKEATGHYETIHHEAVTHEEPIYENVKWICIELDDGYYEEHPLSYWNGADAMMDYYEALTNSRNTTGHWWTDYRDTIIETRMVVDQVAWDEQVWVEDTPAQPDRGHWETVSASKWVIDKAAWDEQVWIVDKPEWDEKVTIQGHYETVHHVEEGHWEQQGC